MPAACSKQPRIRDIIYARASFRAKGPPRTRTPEQADLPVSGRTALACVQHCALRELGRRDLARVHSPDDHFCGKRRIAFITTSDPPLRHWLDIARAPGAHQPHLNGAHEGKEEEDGRVSGSAAAAAAWPGRGRGKPGRGLELAGLDLEPRRRGPGLAWSRGVPGQEPHCD